MMSSNFVQVHPLVLLNVVDHITRFSLSLKPSPPTSNDFFNTSGLLMGTASAAALTSDSVVGSCNAVATTTLSSSFELPLKLNEVGEPIAPSAPSGDAAFMVHVLQNNVDWRSARRYREQVDAVMPDSLVVGCYVVCSGVRSAYAEGRDGGGQALTATPKKPRNESQRGAHDITQRTDLQSVAHSLAKQLQQAELLPATADGFVLLVVYDGEVAALRGGGSSSDTAAPYFAASTAPSPLGVHRLPFETLWVSTVDEAATGPVGEEKAEEDSPAVIKRTVPCAVPVPVAVVPADMEWIGLANEALIMRDACASSVCTPTSPRNKPSFLRRCGALLLSASVSPTEPSIVSIPVATDPASAHSANASEGLLRSLRLLRRVLETPQGTSPMHPNAHDAMGVSGGSAPSAELLRTVATCVRNVPDGSCDSRQSSDAPPSEDLVRAVLALEAQCAMRLADVQSQQQSVVLARVKALSATDRRGSPSPYAWTSAMRGAMRDRLGEMEEAHAAVSATAAAAGTWFPPRREGLSKHALVKVFHGHMWPAEDQ
ncbi:hypothetical protein ABL78_8356 [Leptomonas seymouri]|uniref:Uncharacterized protein n=1 Tax=Leptomonas seymouri TaxID=5684 RepID=A0A0N1HYC0_LEPSE|nr:hypothetical protein ABL78_8356 [Leptomonas seymouri]|eukprot:KPI82634.1 hypothetical protein ABL78_8356 [Leptomonas seymouri]